MILDLAKIQQVLQSELAHLRSRFCYFFVDKSVVYRIFVHLSKSGLILKKFWQAI